MSIRQGDQGNRFLLIQRGARHTGWTIGSLRYLVIPGIRVSLSNSACIERARRDSARKSGYSMKSLSKGRGQEQVSEGGGGIPTS